MDFASCLEAPKDKGTTIEIETPPPTTIPLKAVIIIPKLLTISMMVRDVVVVFTNAPIQSHAGPLKRAKDNYVIAYHGWYTPMEWKNRATKA